jgi:hypothetical protein
MIIKRFGIFSLGKFFGILYGGMGLLGGLFITGINVLGMIFAGNYQSPYSSSSSFSNFSSFTGIATGLGAVVCLPILYGILGFIGGIITAFISNLALKVSGGLEIDMVDNSAVAPSQAVLPPIPSPPQP